MILNEQEKNLIARLFNNPVDGQVFRSLLLRKVKELHDISTFRTIDFEKEMSLELIYTARMHVVQYLEDVLKDMTIIAEPIEPERSKPRI